MRRLQAWLFGCLCLGLAACLPATAQSRLDKGQLDQLLAPVALYPDSLLSQVLMGATYPDDIAAQRVIHLDQYSARPLVDVSFADYGPVAKAIEWGVNTHLGQTFGAANQIVLLLACAGIVLLAVSAAVMWWKRRPSRALGVPPLPSDRRVFGGLFVLLGIGGVLFPLTGLSMVVMIALDLIGQRVAALARPARTA